MSIFAVKLQTPKENKIRSAQRLPVGPEKCDKPSQIFTACHGRWKIPVRETRLQSDNTSPFPPLHPSSGENVHHFPLLGDG